MNNSLKVLNGSVGNLNSKIMFVGEAPGRLGADDTGIPFHGDISGHNFEDLLKISGLTRNDIYVTNAVLCNPKDEKGNNSTPKKEEQKNCASYLKAQIDLINPLIVVTLGSKALESACLIDKIDLTLRKNVRTINQWYNRKLIPLYHPGQRAMIHRSMANQRSDYQFVAEKLKRIISPSQKLSNKGKTNIEVSLIVEYLLKLKPTISYFKLHKLFYLIEYFATKELGYRLTNSYIVRQKDGPYCTDLHIRKLTNSIPNLKCRWFKNGSFEIYKTQNSLFEISLLDEYELDSGTIEIIEKVFYKYGKMNNFDLKRCVYITSPMRRILRLESEDQINMFNSPLRFESTLEESVKLV